MFKGRHAACLDLENTILISDIKLADMLKLWLLVSDI